MLGAKLFDQVGTADDFFRSPRANPFDHAGNDVIDVSALFMQADAETTALGVAIYGGGGDDTLIGSGAGDHLAGGSGDDTIRGNGGVDLVYGDPGFNVDPITRTLVVVTADSGVGTLPFGAVRDNLVAGSDTLEVGSGADVIFGDHGQVTQDVPRGRVYADWMAASGRPAVFGYATGNATNSQFALTASDKLLTTGFIQVIRTAEPGNGAADTVRGDAGRDRIFGGNGSDVIDGGAGADVIFGDQGHLNYLGADYNGDVETGLAGLGTLDLLESVETEARFGADDTITDDVGDDIIVGGQGNDVIDTGAGQNIVFGDHGRILGMDTGVNHPDAGAVGNPADDDYQVQVLGLVTAIDWGSVNGAANEFGNGNDTITTGIGRDIVIGGGGDDTISTFASNGGTAALDGSNIVFGDHGLIDYLAEEGLQGSATNPARSDDIDRVWSIAAATRIGGKDRITTGAGEDIVLGGTDADTIDGGNGHNIVFGDNGLVTTGSVDDPLTPFTVHEFTVQTMASIGFLDADNGADFITTGSGSDVLLGGGAGDEIRAGAGADLVFGDQGLAEGFSGAYMPTLSLPALAPELLLAGQRTLVYTALNTTTNDGSGDDIVYGGLGDDFIHGGAGNDALSGAEALTPFYDDVRAATTAPFQYDTVTRKPYFYDADQPMVKVDGFLLNFEAFRNGVVLEDGKDQIFGDLGNDALFGGTGHDRLFGGLGDDYHQLDDNLDTNGGLNDETDDATDVQNTAGAGDFAYGGGGLDVLIANTGHDRMFDWTGEFNSFVVPFSRFGAPTINRLISPATLLFITELATAGGADRSLAEPNGEIGLVTQRDPEWRDQHGGPRDPQPGNGRAQHDGTGGKEDDRTLAPLQTEHGSTPSGGVPGTPESAAAIHIESAINAVAALSPTVAEDADLPPGPALAAGAPLTLTYLVTNTTPDGSPIFNVQVLDDAGTPGNMADDIAPAYVSGDDGDNVLEVGEVWLYAAPAGPTAQAGAQRHLATVLGTSAAGNAVEDSDLVFYNGPGTPPVSIRIEKALNAVNPMAPTVAEDADTAPGATFAVGTPVIWTYQVFNTGAEALQIDTLVDDFGTPTLAGDDFSPLAVMVSVAGVDFNIGDSDRDNLLDAGEVWLFTSAGTAAGGYTVVAGAYGNLARVSGTTVATGVTVSDDDAAYHFGVQIPPVEPRVRLEKDVNAVDPNAPTAYEDADAPTGPVVTVGSAVVWTYQVINIGNVAFAVTELRDDAGTANITSDDFTPVAVLAAGSNFNAGDIDRDGLVDTEEVWLYRATGTASLGQYVNSARVVVTEGGSGATATSTDLAHHYGTPVGIHVVKAVNAVRPLTPTTTEDANNPATPVVLAAGTTVVFSYAVRNTGSDALATVSLIDDAGTPAFAGDDFVPSATTVTAGGKTYNTGDSNKNGLLDRNEVWLYTATRTVGEGAHTNIANVAAVNSRTQIVVRDDDPASTFGAVARIDIEKAINAADPTRPTVAEDADDPANPVVLNVGADVTFTYLLSSAGNGPLAVNRVFDDAGTPDLTSDDFAPAAVLAGSFNVGDANRNGLLDLGEVWRYTSAGTSADSTAALQGLHTNTVTATGTDTRTGRTATDADTASYLGKAGAVRVEKAVNAVHATAPTRYEDADLPTGPVLEVGSPVVWTYLVYNQSDVTLDLTDIVDSDGFQPQLVGGDIDMDDQLDIDEVWLFTSRGVDGATTSALAGQQSNTVTVRVADEDGTVYTEEDIAHYFGTTVTDTSSIRIVKAINAVDRARPTVQEDANSADQPVVLAAGSVPTYTFLVTNLGTQSLRDIVITDDAATATPDDDFKPVPMKRGQQIVGDADRDGLLDPGETWQYTSAGVYTVEPPSGAYVNVAQVTGTNVATGTTVRDDDVAHFVVGLPGEAMGRMTGGGSVFTEDGMRVTHGFELHCDINIGPNNLQVNFDRNRFHLEELTSVTCYDDPNLDPLPRPAPFDTLIGVGTGRFNNQSGYTVRFTFTDNGEPGKTDFAQIEIRDPQGRVVLFVAGNLHNGNHQAHPENKTAQLLASALPLRDATAPLPALDAAQLAPLVAQARSEWMATGATEAQLARLDATQFRVADLPGRVLGQTQDGEVTIDTDAAGWGWFVDATPQDAREYRSTSQGLVATGGPAAGRMDLLTVLSHEMGHVLGLDHDAAGVMEDQLSAGQRSLGAGQPDLTWGQPVAVGLRSGAMAVTQPSAFDKARIDWASPTSIEPAGFLSTQRDKGIHWLERFVNHGGAETQRINPNSTLRLHLDATPKLTNPLTASAAGLDRPAQQVGSGA